MTVSSGGGVRHRFPWMTEDTITHSRANYWRTNKISGIQLPYNVSSTLGFHPDYDKNNTSPVGSFAPNGYGLYDMAGNVSEVFWVEGDSVRFRGSGWRGSAIVMKCASQYGFLGYDGQDWCGFRCVCR